MARRSSAALSPRSRERRLAEFPKLTDGRGWPWLDSMRRDPRSWHPLASRHHSFRVAKEVVADVRYRVDRLLWSPLVVSAVDAWEPWRRDRAPHRRRDLLRGCHGPGAVQAGKLARQRRGDLTVRKALVAQDVRPPSQFCSHGSLATAAGPKRQMSLPILAMLVPGPLILPGERKAEWPVQRVAGLHGRTGIVWKARDEPHPWLAVRDGRQLAGEAMRLLALDHCPVPPRDVGDWMASQLVTVRDSGDSPPNAQPPPSSACSLQADPSARPASGRDPHRGGAWASGRRC